MICDLHYCNRKANWNSSEDTSNVKKYSVWITQNMWDGFQHGKLSEEEKKSDFKLCILSLYGVRISWSDKEGCKTSFRALFTVVQPGHY